MARELGSEESRFVWEAENFLRFVAASEEERRQWRDPYFMDKWSCDGAGVAALRTLLADVKHRGKSVPCSFSLRRFFDLGERP